MGSARLIFVGAALAAAAAKQVTISNVKPRVDTDGNIIDAHDGNAFLKDGVYYWYAASYGNCKEPAGPSGCADTTPGACGFQYNHNVSLHTSTDLVTWTTHAAVIQAAVLVPNTIMFCPKVLFNAATQKWVAWFNYVDFAHGGWAASYYGVATADAPTGPWTLVTPRVLSLAHNDTGDFNLALSPDGTEAYIIYTSEISSSPSHLMSVERLTPDFTNSLGAAASSGFIGASFVEAPVLFSRPLASGAVVWYSVFGSCCCYCQAGSPVTVYTSTAGPLGPYSTQNVISTPAGGAACAAAARGDRSRAATLLDALAAPAAGERVCAGDAISSQQTAVVAFAAADGSTQYLWIGDRWQSAPDGIKAHDFTFWSPLVFTADGNVTAMTAIDEFTIDVA